MPNMKINWFSPLPPLPTDIAHYTQRILPALAARAEVVLWTDQGKVERDLRERFEVRRFRARRVDWAEVNRADVNFYNIGNDPRFHEAIWEASRRAPGIVVLHDASLQHFFGGVFLGQRRDLAAYVRLMETCYGAEGRAAAQEYFAHDDKDAFLLHLAAHFPLTELALDGALAALVHTREVYERLQADLPCVCAYAPLPYPSLSEPATVFKTNKRFADDARARRLIVFGYTGPNRRLAPLLHALAGMPERARFRLDIYGQLWDAEYVRGLARELGLNAQVNIHGFVAEEELERALAHSDLAINLRYPTMGEASGSQLRLWSQALPSLVTAVDWYAQLPIEAVAHVRIEHETADIQHHLRDLLNDPARFVRMGEAGRRTLEAAHAPEAYADSLMMLLEHLPAMRSRAAAFHLTKRAASEAARWANAEAHDEIARKVSSAVYELTSDNLPACADEQ